MPRPDYDKFIHSYESAIRYKLFCRELPGFDDKRMAYPYARLCDMKQTYVDPGTQPWVMEDVGVWIDIFPCDGIPSDENEERKHLRKNYLMEKRAYWSIIRYVPWSNITKGKNLYIKMRFMILKCLSCIMRVNSFNKIFQTKKQYDYTSSEYFFATPHYMMREWQPKKYMESFILHKFEDREFYIMSGYDDNLKSLFGDYMKLPPEDKRRYHILNRYYLR